ncbi:MAG: type II secretion system protein GspD [Oligosphaeraceae bacterium]
MNSIRSTLLLLAGATTALLAADQTISLQPQPLAGKAKAELNAPSEPYASSSVQAHLRLDIKDGTKAIHFIRDNNDPRVITKTYELKHANPYGLRFYLNAIINAKKVDANAPSVTAVLFHDGRKLLIVSAEDYRFQDTEHGESIDKLVAKLDQPGLTASSGRPKHIYFPKVNAAANLKQMVANVGASGVDVEFDGGVDKLLVDGELNALFVASPNWSWQAIRDQLAQYDRPMPEIRLRYRVVEVFAENDDAIGHDIQSWRNGDGASLFSVGGRYRTNWGETIASGIATSKASSTDYISVSPRWNSRYLDFLATRGKARTLTSGVLTAKNRQTSTLSIGSGLLYAHVAKPLQPDATAALDPEDKTALPAVSNLAIQKGPETTTDVKDGFRFALNLVNPVINAESSTLNLQAESVSLLGWQADGTPRLNTSRLDTTIQVGHQAKEFVIGGLKRVSVVESASGIPLLRDIPYLGWLFGTRGTSTKTSSIVILATAEYALPFDEAPADVKDAIAKATAALPTAASN